MSTLSKKDPLTEQPERVERDHSVREGEVFGTIAIGLGGMQERLEEEAVDAFRSSSSGPQLPATLTKKERRTKNRFRSFWQDETSLPSGEAGDSLEAKKKNIRLIVLGILAIASLMVYVAWEGGLLEPQLERLFG